MSKGVHGHIGLRGIAALCVFSYHLHLNELFSSPAFEVIARLSAWASVAVDLFFMLSGYILCHVYFMNRKLEWRSFFVARLARIVPLAVGVVGFCSALDAYSFLRHGIPSSELALQRLIPNLLLIQGLWGDAVANSINPPSWSISVELFLYVALFPLLCAVGEVIKSSRVISVTVAFVCIAGLAACYHENIVPPSAHWLMRGVFGFSFGFVARVSDLETWAPRKSLVVAGIICLIAMTALLLTQQATATVLVPIVALLCVASAPNGTILSRLLSGRGLTWLGEHSYSIYLLHHPLMVLFNRLILYPSQKNGIFSDDAIIKATACKVVFTLVLAAVCYRYFEVPVRAYLRTKLAKNG
jgi:peptidoglycan/LPS O-acetylase OafA/YrhL